MLTGGKGDEVLADRKNTEVLSGGKGDEVLADRKVLKCGPYEG